MDVDLLHQQFPKHADKVKDVQQQVKEKVPGDLLVVKKDTRRHQLRKQCGERKAVHSVDVSGLNEILEIDANDMFAVVEGQVDMGHLVDATLPLGFVPMVVPEYRDFTCGGLVNGEGVQTSCHKFGLFTKTVVGVEVVLGNGDVVWADSETNADLFGGIMMSQGTLGFVTLVKVRLIPAKPYVCSTYYHYDNVDEFVHKLDELKNSECIYLDGVVFSPTHYTVTASYFIDSDEGLPVYHPEDKKEEGIEWYFQWMMRTKERNIEKDAIPTDEFLFRYMRGGWWVVSVYANTPLLNDTNWGRRMLDKQTKNSISFLDENLSVEERERCIVTQDLCIELERLKDGLQKVQNEFCVYPLWACVINPEPQNSHSLFYRQSEKKMPWTVDIGIWGEPKCENYQNRKQMHDLQKFVRYPSLWGITYLEPKELEEIFDIDQYVELRRKYFAEGNFIDVRNKVAFFDSKVKDKGPIPAW
eukprot:CAMPEP_0174254758 /NCGR_PEP_ID=MMETSP0439-20130205/4095_1 /TAXON_ID=0 /ORGANISM="Stereomyxa ramosa, Strain Chinc5" /LENGTH=470 /DNA_ID=CAMNT_0015336559 /DNA_START=1 /DNA_END=1410 /DNA_ORIENTATION=-